MISQEVDFYQKKFWPNNKIFNFRIYFVFLIIHILLMSSLSIFAYFNRLEKIDDYKLKEFDLVNVVKALDKNLSSAKLKSSENEIDYSLINSAINKTELIKKNYDLKWGYFLFDISKLKNHNQEIDKIDIDGYKNEFEIYTRSTNIYSLEEMKTFFKRDDTSYLNNVISFEFKKNDAFWGYSISGRNNK